jgi:hypothetical protein
MASRQPQVHPPTLKGALRALSIGLVTQTTVVIGHFVYGAVLYDDVGREHVILPALVALAMALSLQLLLAWRNGRIALGLLSLVVGAFFVGLFGIYHGGITHGAKLLWHHAGASPERLVELFDSPDFAVPNDIAFELTGLSTLVLAGVVAWLLVRVIRVARAMQTASPS